MATFSLKAMLGLDGKGFKAGISSAGKQVDSFAGKMSSVKNQLAGAFSAVAIANYSKEVVNLASHISDIAGQTGMSVSSWETISRVAGDAGVNIAKVENSMLKVRQSQDEALASGGLMADAWKTLGVTIDEVAALRTDELFQRMSDAIVQSNRGAAEMQAITAIIGQDSAPAMLEIFQRIGSEGIEPIKKGLQEVGAIFSDELAAKLDMFGDRMAQQSNTVKRMWGAALGWFGKEVEVTLAALGDATAGAKVSWVDVGEALLNPVGKAGEILGTLSASATLARDQIAAESAEKMQAIKDQEAAEQEALKASLNARLAAEDQVEAKRIKSMMDAHAKVVADETARRDKAREDQMRKDKAAAIKKAGAMARAEIREKEESIRQMEGDLRDVQGRLGADSLRNIGANILGSGKNPWTDTARAMERQIDIAKKQLAKLQEIAGKDETGGVF